MKIFGFQFGAAKSKQAVVMPPVADALPMAFSSPFITLPKGNLSQPYIQNRYSNGNWVNFGAANDYPQILTQLYFQSPLHGAIIEFITNSIVGGGWEWDTKKNTREKIDLFTFDKANNLNKLIRLLTRDWLMHRRVTVLVTKHPNRTSLTRVDPSYVRNSADLETFYWSNDWRGGVTALKTYKKCYPNSAEKESLFVYQDETPGQDVYPIPAYNSILNWAALDSDIAFFQKSNMQNSIFPSIVIRRPKEFQSLDEVEKFKAGITENQGAGNAGRVLVLSGNGKDDVPEFGQISANNNESLFVNAGRECKEQICFAWGINPSLMGLKVAGSLGNASELQMSYGIYEKSVVIPTRTQVEDFIKSLLFCAGVETGIKFNNFQIIDGEIVDKTTKI
jgi:hypothetical protein